ncbi:MAG: HlyD family secretion protein [Chitinophagaceae bacterium]|nr:MAG: HlyD family secretion protein [Chitinophagaceae bacterium]
MKKQEQPVEGKKRNPVFIIILALLVVGGGWFGISRYLHGLKHEETEDAQVAADISPVIPRISGYVQQIKVNDNQWVKKGDTLMVLDNRDYLIKVEQAEAALATSRSSLNNARATTSAAKANVGSVRASINTIDAQIEAAKVNLWRASKDYDRYANLIKDRSITQQQFEQAQAAKESAEKQVAILEGQRRQAAQQTNAVAVQSDATAQQIETAGTNIRQREVDVEAAKLALSYTVIVAPEDGLVSKVNVNAGQFVQAGQALFSIVHSDKVWVVANFKETQLNKMVEGQKVVIHADVFPDHPFEARLASFSPATGSTFALLPPDNASGNFVKVVQRLPVRIEFLSKSDSLVKRLRPGMNVTVDVHLKS